MMKKGFTILEMLVASLLLGLLTMILTMLMNQSSISWRIGTAGVADLDDVRERIGEIREEADNIYVWDNKAQRLLGVWDLEKGGLRKRAWNVEGEGGQSVKAITGVNDSTKPDQIGTIAAGSGDSGAGRKIKTYTVNVMSAGPNGFEGDFDDIWSYPDDIEL